MRIDWWSRDYDRSILVRVGPWQIKLSWPDGGRYCNGSRWHSSWHRWNSEPGY